MNLPRFALTHRPIVIGFTLLFIAAGLVNFSSMGRREDPEIVIRDALILTAWPGTSAQRVEQLVTDPLEKVLIEIPEIDTIESKSMPGLSVIQVAADETIADIEQVWDDVRAKVESVATLPEGVPRPIVNTDFGDVFEIVYCLHQKDLDGAPSPHRYTPRELEIIAERIEDQLQLLPTVGRVEFWGNQEERIYIEFDSSDAAKFDLTAHQLRDLFQARNILVPGGEVDTAQSRYSIEPSGEFESIKDIEQLVLLHDEGRAPVQLRHLPVTITRRYEEPARQLARLTTPVRPHEPAIAIGISMKSGSNVAEMQRAVAALVARLQRTIVPPDVGLTRVNDLPRQVIARIGDFQSNLVLGVFIVLGVAFLMMGWRPALVMATAVPISMIAAFAIVPRMGVELEQFSIASLIIALGMVVDNAIVVSDNAVRLMSEGRGKFEAIARGAQDLAIPMLTSTLTTIAAFLPMLTITGNAGEYISSLPVVVAATLGISFVAAMLVTPIMCAWLLLPQGDAERARRGLFDRLDYEAVIRGCLRRPVLVVAAAGVAFAASLAILPVIGTQFFPGGERDQFFIKIWLPESAPIQRTADVAREIEAALVAHSPAPDGTQRLESAATFIGSGGPRLMLTQEPEYDYPYYALILVNTTDAAHTAAYAQAMRGQVADHQDARITVSRFMLGPPIRNPVELRLSGPDHETVDRAGEEMVRLFKQTPGTVRPFSNWGASAGRVAIEIDPYAANLAGVTNADIAVTTSMLLSGAQLTVFREGDHLVPVMLRAIRGKRADLLNISDIYVSGRNGRVPLNAVARVVPGAGPSVIARRNGLPTVTVACDVEPGLLSNTVAGRIRPKVDALRANLGDDYFVEPGGELEETVDTQAKVMTAIGISVVTMFLLLVMQYNSLVKPIVILTAIPLGMIGVLLGLLATGWAMGFMAILGLLSLGGIVINNAIVLVDFVETNVAEGQELRVAVANAGRVRMRPIILTTLTTIGGLLPLSLFGGALWAPMTNGMIFGLIVSTALTLVVIPCLYVLFAERLGMSVNPPGS
ncbi:MAG: hypothetical protein CMJ18_20150 [Phycisphaeraceae bacterium]|nr:hypothetical protein [Phycisphaeraceae bacterium]